jgi:hypothetical protein
LPNQAVTGQPDQTPENPEQHSSEKNHDSKQAAPTPKIIEREKAQPETKVNSAQAPEKPTNSRDWNVSDTIALIAAFVAALQFGALVATIGVMILSARRQLRAYVSGQPNFIFSFDKINPIRVSFNLLNVGATPAHKVRHRGNVTIAPNPIVAGFALPELTNSFSPPLVLFPNLQFNGTIGAENVFSVAQIAQIIDGRAVIYAYGEILYEDIFGTERTTRFCSRAIADRETLQKLADNYGPKDLSVSFEVAPMGNSAT